MRLRDKAWTKRKIIALVVISLILLLATITVMINLVVILQTTSYIQTKFSEDVSYDCILVLGAGLKADGTPSNMLEDRLRGAIELYHEGVSDTVVLSGDCSGEQYDEVSAMENYCLSWGIPKECIVRDDYGYSTYESMENILSAKEYRNIVVVTQKYHLYRALYIAQALEINAVGFSADYHSYRGQIFRDVREVFARIKDFCVVSYLSLANTLE